MKEATYPTFYFSDSTENDIFTSKRIALYDEDIAFREYGLQEDPVIILLHSFGSSSAMFKDLPFQQFRGYRIIAPDYPGFGNSSGKPGKQYNFDDIICFLEDFINVMGFNDRPTYLLDFVIPIGLRLCLKYPETIRSVLFAELSSTMSARHSSIPNLNLEQLLSISPDCWPPCVNISADELFCTAKMIISWSTVAKGMGNLPHGHIQDASSKVFNTSKIAFLLQSILWIICILNLALCI